MTTPPPTATGRPRSAGSSRCSTDAKNASRSAWRMDARTNTCSPTRQARIWKTRAMTPPTQQDAALMLQAAQWGAQIGLVDANQTLFSDEFDPDTADIRQKEVSTVLAFGETIGT